MVPDSSSLYIMQTHDYGYSFSCVYAFFRSISCSTIRYQTDHTRQLFCVMFWGDEEEMQARARVKGS